MNNLIPKLSFDLDDGDIAWTKDDYFSLTKEKLLKEYFNWSNLLKRCGKDLDQHLINLLIVAQFNEWIELHDHSARGKF